MVQRDMKTTSKALVSPASTSSLLTTSTAAAVPTEDWTIEQVLQQYFSKGIKLVEDEENMVVQRLDEQFNVGVAECYEMCKENALTTPNNHDTTTTAAARSQSFRVVITAGPHAPHTVVLHAHRFVPCMVGRSKGKKFRENGLSLFKDGEVSTTHGHFLYDGAALYFVDIGCVFGRKVSVAK